jgi:hypothetical protein
MESGWKSSRVVGGAIAQTLKLSLIAPSPRI